MQTIEFLRLVLPATGYYAVLIIDPQNKPHQILVDSIEKAAQISLTADKNNTVYYGVSSYKEKTSRKQANVQATKVIFVDIDCGANKPYLTQKDGIIALHKFLEKTHLPLPFIVNSGTGLHSYWILDKELAPDNWKVLANALKAAAKTHDFFIDASKTGDCAAVLRAIGTTNKKASPPAPVVALTLATSYSSDKLASILSAYAHSIPTRSGPSSLSSALTVKYEWPLAKAGLIAQKCKQVYDIATCGGNVEEPLWYAALGIAAYCEESEHVADAWSSGYPGYNKKETHKKLEQWKSKVEGPTTCTRFEALNPSGCKGCKFKGKIGSPVKLGVRHEEAQKEPDDPSNFPIPRPFKRTKDGIKILIDDVEIDVCNFDIYPIGQGRDEHVNYEVARFKWNRPFVGWQVLELPVRDLAEDSQDFTKRLGDAGIVLATKKQGVYMSLMLRSFISELNSNKAAVNLYSSMGWKEDYSEFVLGGVILNHTPDGVVEEQIGLSRNAPKHILNAYTSKGTLEKWANFTAVLNQEGLAHCRFILGIAFACPLWSFGGLGGLVISLFGETGAGKTTLQNWIQSVYGNPDELLIPAVATQNATFSRLGVYNNLPATVDEMSVLQAKDISTIVYWASLGKDKPRLTTDAVERDAKKFSTILTGSTNIAINSKLLSGNFENEALMMRVLEPTIPRHALFSSSSESGRTIHNFLRSNYGTAGKVYLSYLVEQGPARLREMVNTHIATFSRRYGVKFSGEERFWEHGIVLTDLGNSIAKELGLIKYNYEEGTRWILNQLRLMRATVTENALDSFDIISKYLSEFVGSSIVATYIGNNSASYDLTRLPKTEIVIRYNLFKKTPKDKKFERGIVYLDRSNFTKWATANGFDQRKVRKDMEDVGLIKQPTSDRYSMGRDTPIKTAQVYVLGIILMHPRFASLLNDLDTHEGALGELKQIIEENK